MENHTDNSADTMEHTRDYGKISVKPQTFNHNDPEYKPHLLTSPEDSIHLCPVHYSYDYLPHRPQWLAPQPLFSPTIISGSKENGPASSNPSREQKAKSGNSIPLYLSPAGLPAHTGLSSFRQSKHWKSIVRVTKELLELFAVDHSCKEIMLSRRSGPTINHNSEIEKHDTDRAATEEDNARSMASLAQDQLEKGVLDSFCRYSIYLWPEADEERVKLIAQTVVLTFMFDGTLT